MTKTQTIILGALFGPTIEKNPEPEEQPTGRVDPGSINGPTAPKWIDGERMILRPYLDIPPMVEHERLKPRPRSKSGQRAAERKAKGWR